MRLPMRFKNYNVLVESLMFWLAVGLAILLWAKGGR